MAEFYSARGWEIPPLPWTNLSPPFSLAGVLIVDALTLGAMTPLVIVVGSQFMGAVAEAPAAMGLAGNGAPAGAF